jgi:methylmalonyl-CoA mutase N-terminal domain/subunit
VDPGAADRQIAKLKQVRARRDGDAVAKGLQRLKDDCQANRNIMPATLECVKAYATIGEIADVWREVFGVYVPESVRF